MNPENASLEDLYWHASRLTSDAERCTYIERACGQDIALRTELEELLKYQDAADRFADAFFPPVRAEQSNHVGQMIDSYKILQEIGHGGMGIVYMAQQSSPLNRLVALKIIKPGLGTSEAIARFEAERQALAMMDHPNIARVLDAGTTAEGLPYFVMELIRGTPLIQFCDEQRLKTRERLILFADICRGVQHAHQKGILHRDLKPSNILVAMHDQVPVPKIIDFGVAKALHGPLSQRTLFTYFGQILGTLEYMSPEQFQFNQLDIDTRSDVYSLGVILYQLLTGEPPHARHRFQKVAIDEISRMVREEEPLIPSLKLSSAAARATVALNQQSDPARLVSYLRGELDWITAKTLEKNRERRYPSCAALAEEVQRFLDGEAVLAGPPGTWYRLSKLSRRHRVPLAAGAAILSALVLGTVVSLSYAFRADRARHEAEQAQQLAEDRLAQLSAKQQALEASEKVAQANYSLASQAVQNWIAHVGRFRLRDHPELAALRQELLVNADELYTELLSSSNADPSLLLSRAQVRRALHRNEEDLADLLQLLERQPNNFELHLDLAHVYREAGRTKEAVNHAARATQIEPLNAEGWYQLAWSHASSGDVQNAATHMRRAMELPQDPQRLVFKTGCALEFEGSYREAALKFQEAALLAGVIKDVCLAREAECWRKCKEFEKSLAAFNACLELDAFRPDLWHRRAHLHELMGSKEKAMQDWDRALALDPNFEASLVCVLQCHLDAKNHPAAADLLQSRSGAGRADLALLQPSFWTAMEGTGNPDLLASRDALLDRILQKFPITPQPDRYIELARKITQPQRIIDILQDRLLAVDDHVGARLRLLRGRFLVQAKQWESAIRDFESALTHDSSPPRLNEAAWLLAMPPDSPSYERAVEWARRATDMGDHPRYLNTLALTLLRAKEHKSALTTLDVSIQHPAAGSVTHAWYHLIKALTLSELERWDEAAEAFQVVKTGADADVRESVDWQQLESEVRSNLAGPR